MNQSQGKKSHLTLGGFSFSPLSRAFPFDLNIYSPRLCCGGKEKSCDTRSKRRNWDEYSTGGTRVGLNYPGGRNAPIPPRDFYPLRLLLMRAENIGYFSIITMLEVWAFWGAGYGVVVGLLLGLLTLLVACLVSDS